MNRQKLDDATIRRVNNMLTSRLLTVNRGQGTLKVAAEHGCPQGGVLSPLLWRLVVNDLIERLNGDEIYEVCSENNGNLLISRVWRVLLSNFFYYVGVHAPEV